MAPARADPPAAGRDAPVLPDASQIIVMVRTSLLTLNDALRSGNFTVLRDVAAPSFRDANTAARLSQSFAPLMRDRIDLSAVAVLPPDLTEAPAIDPASGQLLIKGRFALGASSVAFKLAYQNVQGRWRLFGISVRPVADLNSERRVPPLRPPVKGAAKKKSAE